MRCSSCFSEMLRDGDILVCQRCGTVMEPVDQTGPDTRSTLPAPPSRAGRFRLTLPGWIVPLLFWSGGALVAGLVAAGLLFFLRDGAIGPPKPAMNQTAQGKPGGGLGLMIEDAAAASPFARRQEIVTDPPVGIAGIATGPDRGLTLVLADRRSDERAWRLDLDRNGALMASLALAIPKGHRLHRPVRGEARRLYGVLEDSRGKISVAAFDGGALAWQAPLPERAAQAPLPYLASNAEGGVQVLMQRPARGQLAILDVSAQGDAQLHETWSQPADAPSGAYGRAAWFATAVPDQARELRLLSPEGDTRALALAWDETLLALAPVGDVGWISLWSAPQARLSRHDADGTVRWEAPLPTFLSLEDAQLAAAPSGGVTLALPYTSEDGARDIWFTRYDPAGNRRSQTLLDMRPPFHLVPARGGEAWLVAGEDRVQLARLAPLAGVGPGPVASRASPDLADTAQETAPASEASAPDTAPAQPALPAPIAEAPTADEDTAPSGAPPSDTPEPAGSAAEGVPPPEPAAPPPSLRPDPEPAPAPEPEALRVVCTFTCMSPIDAAAKYPVENTLTLPEGITDVAALPGLSARHAQACEESGGGLPDTDRAPRCAPAS